MAYTRHGHHIKGSPLVDRPAGLLTGRCGGPEICTDCKIDKEKVLAPKEPEVAEKPKKVYYTKETVDRLYEVLRDSEILDVDQTFAVIDALQNAGVYVRLTKEA